MSRKDISNTYGAKDAVVLLTGKVKPCNNCCVSEKHSWLDG